MLPNARSRAARVPCQTYSHLANVRNHRSWLLRTSLTHRLPSCLHIALTRKLPSPHPQPLPVIDPSISLANLPSCTTFLVAMTCFSTEPDPMHLTDHPLEDSLSLRKDISRKLFEAHICEVSGPRLPPWLVPMPWRPEDDLDGYDIIESAQAFWPPSQTTLDVGSDSLDLWETAGMLRDKFETCDDASLPCYVGGVPVSHS